MKTQGDKELTEHEVRKLLEDANLNRLNIFHDRNAIIARLCKALLDSWDKNQENSQ